MRRQLLWFTTLLILWVISARAQTGDFVPYAWEAGDLALVVPADWDEPRPAEADNGQPVLHLAQAFVTDPLEDRPPGVPSIRLSLHSGEADDVYPPLETTLGELGIEPSGPVAASLAGVPGVQAVGTGADGQFYGTGRAARLPGGDVLVVAGRSLAEQRETFQQTLNMIANSIVQGADTPPNTPDYGVVWYTQRTAAEGESAFLDLTGLAYAAESLYTVDFDPSIGVIRFDATDGTVLETFPFETDGVPSAVAVDDAGTVYVGDVLCGCVRVLGTDGQWEEPFTGFAEEAPASIAVTGGGTLYATDVDEAGTFVRVFNESGENRVEFDAFIAEQPLLAIDRGGQLLALDPLNGTVLGLEDDTLVPLFDAALQTLTVNAMTVDMDNHLALATAARGIVFLDESGEEIDRAGQAVSSLPLPGEVVNPMGVAIGPDGTLYWADSDGSFGAVAAMSKRVESGRMGATDLVPGVPVQGVLDDTTPQQTWTFEGRAGEQVTLTAVVAGAEALDIALRLLGPEGDEIAANDNYTGEDLLVSPFDARVEDVTLAAGGIYFVIVELVGGEGPYDLGMTRTESFDLAAGSAQLAGELSPLFSKQRWTFDGHAGQVITVTMAARSGTLDPLLRLLGPDGELLAENDDALDPALGRDAQLDEVSLPQDGRYTITATRFEGQGRYELTVTAGPE